MPNRIAYPHAALRTGIGLLAGLATTSAVLLWGWNVLADDLLPLPHAEFRHAVAAQAVIASILFLGRMLGRVVARVPRDA
jgi:hypothetical protein